MLTVGPEHRSPSRGVARDQRTREGEHGGEPEIRHHRDCDQNQGVLVAVGRGVQVRTPAATESGDPGHGAVDVVEQFDRPHEKTEEQQVPVGHEGQGIGGAQGEAEPGDPVGGDTRTGHPPAHSIPAAVHAVLVEFVDHAGSPIRLGGKGGMGTRMRRAGCRGSAARARDARLGTPLFWRWPWGQEVTGFPIGERVTPGSRAAREPRSHPRSPGYSVEGRGGRAVIGSRPAFSRSADQSHPQHPVEQDECRKGVQWPTQAEVGEGPRGFRVEWLWQSSPRQASLRTPRTRAYGKGMESEK